MVQRNIGGRKHPCRASQILQASKQATNMAIPVKIGPIGGSGGTRRDIPANQLPRTLEKIEIWSSLDGPDSGGVINGIRFTYVDTSGRRHIMPNSTSAWGSILGNFHELKLNVRTHEHVKKIDGSIGAGPDGDDAITSLTFTTSNGTKVTYGDPNNGSDFTVPLVNAGIYAFFGNSDNYLNALGFYAQ